MGTMTGKTAIVTGAGHGQGANHCIRLADAGANVVAVDVCTDVEFFYPLASKEELEDTAARCRSTGSDALPIVADVRDPTQVASVLDQTIERFGRVDILCNNAGLARIDAIDEVSDDVLSAILDVNVRGAFNMTRAVTPAMKEQNYGKIINIASAAAVKPLPYLSHYSAAKGAIAAATKSWARELGPWGINVNCIAPGTVLTAMIVGLAAQLDKAPEQAFDEFNSGSVFTGARSHITVDDITDALMFLVSESSRMITGHVLAVDGGKTNT